MIQVTINRMDNRITAFKLSGHADSGPYGYDLVCAGVSAVSIGTVNAVVSLCGADLLIEQGEDGGYLYVQIPDEVRNMEQVQLLFEGMLVSLQSIENEYGEFIRIRTL
ncbi:ribosomal-processing cysteine protease Prp [Oceanobacillus manasiensis]|uniref:ribosomal-processing cysteine protease Prp n=1 Tax=Oceanobacillus manasiensis TaxID=586413 RepID=UPI0005A62732|nr:ribosomal-processing cysteine protease Prp [Oceanobacillus manasiensis]